MDGVPEMVEAVHAFASAGPQGATMPLDEATDFAWDRVYGFNGAVPDDLIARAIGGAFALDDRLKSELGSDSTIVVFTRDGEVVRQAAFGPLSPTAPVWFRTPEDRGGYTPDEAVLTALSEEPGPHSAVQLSRPGGS